MQYAEAIPEGWGENMIGGNNISAANGPYNDTTRINFVTNIRLLY